MGRVREALADLNSACEHQPRDAALLLQRSEAHEALHQLPLALADSHRTVGLVEGVEGEDGAYVTALTKTATVRARSQGGGPLQPRPALTRLSQ